MKFDASVKIMKAYLRYFEASTWFCFRFERLLFYKNGPKENS